MRRRAPRGLGQLGFFMFFICFMLFLFMAVDVQGVRAFRDSVGRSEPFMCFVAFLFFPFRPFDEPCEQRSSGAALSDSGAKQSRMK